MGKTTGADMVAAALEATRKPIGPPNLVDRALSGMDADEAAAWRQALADESISSEWVHRAMTHAGYDVGKTESAVKTWRRTPQTG